MNTIMSILALLAGISTLIYIYKNTNPKEDNIWGKSLTLKDMLVDCFL